MNGPGLAVEVPGRERIDGRHLGPGWPSRGGKNGGRVLGDAEMPQDGRTTPGAVRRARMPTSPWHAGRGSAEREGDSIPVVPEFDRGTAALVRLYEELAAALG
ncbi:MAG: hypothetical protein RQ745_06155 [Longimicrobiales bacterium]|nr:hypothetical protein [Longimicrobiales bacterium]